MHSVAGARNAVRIRGHLHSARGRHAGGVIAAEVVHVDGVGMDQSTQKTLMDPYDTKISIEKVLTQEKKWIDTVNTASVNVKDRDPLSESCIAWMISNGYVPRIRDHGCQR